MSQLVRIDKDYASWIEELSQRYRRSQIKAATHVNSEMLQFYWSLGKDIVTLKAESRWGEKILKYVSADLQVKLPGIKGLSETSIGYAKRFYTLYNKHFTIHPQAVGELPRECNLAYSVGTPQIYNRQILQCSRKSNVLRKKNTRKWMEQKHTIKLHGYRPL